jgi:hypothetical protein
MKTSILLKLKLILILVIANCFVFIQAQTNVSVVTFEPNEPLLLNNGEWAWLSFPRLDRTPNDPTVHEVLYGVNGEKIDPSNYLIYSELKNLPPNQPGEVENIFDGTTWEIGGYLPDIQSTLGYKLYLDYPDPQPEKKWLLLSGTVLDPAEPIAVYRQYDNWVGYWLPESQSPFDAIPDTVLNELLRITAQSWYCVKRWEHQDPESDPYWVCAVHEDPVCLNYGDMVILKTIEDGGSFSFQWQRYGNPPTKEDRQAPENYQYDEQAAYTPFLVELDTSINPLEIGAFVNDSCVGATSILPEDTMVLVPGYIDSLSGDVTFQQYYGTLKSEQLIHHNYYVMDNNTGLMKKRTIHTGENQDYYIISFKDQPRKKDIKTRLWLTCTPNPVKHQCQIEFYIPQECRVIVTVYDLFGRKMNILQDGIIHEGSHNILYNGTDYQGNKLSNGIFIIKINAGKEQAQAKIVIIN